jgi:hypothetical protein
MGLGFRRGNRRPPFDRQRQRCAARPIITAASKRAAEASIATNNFAVVCSRRRFTVRRRQAPLIYFKKFSRVADSIRDALASENAIVGESKAGRRTRRRTAATAVGASNGVVTLMQR